MGDAPARCRQKGQPSTRALAATPHTTPLTPLVTAEVHSYLPYHGLPGIEPEQPNPPKTTASSAGPTARARCRSCPRTSLPLRHTHQLQESGARRAIPPAFISNPTLPHQHHAQPRRRIALFAKCARGHLHGGACMHRRFSVGVRRPRRGVRTARSAAGAPARARMAVCRMAAARCASVFEKKTTAF